MIADSTTFVRAAICHRICSWCGCDLGAFDHYSQHPSYGICESCAHQYFAYLYEPEIVLPTIGAVGERQVGVN
jgi:hypothetical protein